MILLFRTILEEEEDLVDDGVVIYAATPEGVAMPAYAAGDTSTVYLCSSASVLFCSSDSAFGAYGIEISRAAALPDQVAGDIDIY